VRGMATYRTFLVDRRGHICHPAYIFDSADDEAAITHAKQYVHGGDVELWDHARIVAWVGQDGVTVKK
jgi:hypothetical protein